MQNKIKQAMDALVHHDEQLMDMHGEGILEGGYTRASLDQWESSMIRAGKLETTKQRFYFFYYGEKWVCSRLVRYDSRKS